MDTGLQPIMDKLDSIFLKLNSLKYVCIPWSGPTKSALHVLCIIDPPKIFLGSYAIGTCWSRIREAHDVMLKIGILKNRRLFMGGMGQNPIPLVNIKIAGKWMFIPLKMVCIGIDP